MKAAIGVYITMQDPTKPMKPEAASAGFYEHRTNKQKFPRIQLRTVRELLQGKGLERPSTAATIDATLKHAPGGEANRQSAGLGLLMEHRKHRRVRGAYPVLLPVRSSKDHSRISRHIR